MAGGWGLGIPGPRGRLGTSAVMRCSVQFCSFLSIMNIMSRKEAMIFHSNI